MEWEFPSNGGGETDGFNNSSIDTFIGRRVFSLIRETIQNSMDARASLNEPVKIFFSLSEIPKVEALGITELLMFLKMSQKTALDQHGEGHPAPKFFQRAIDKIESSKKILFFSIHDFGTTGLTGPTESGKVKPGAWLALIKGSGLSIKNAPGSLGSFGHGSKAPFAISEIRTVFYFSKIQKNSKIESRFQGKSILQSMEKQNGEVTQGTGYFGHKKGCMPLIDGEVPKWASRLRHEFGAGIGTSLLVPFPDLGTIPSNFWRDIKVSILSNFYYAILRGNLEIGLDNEVINSSNLSECLDSILAKISEEQEDKASELREELRSAITIQYPSTDKHGSFISKSFGEIRWFMRIGQDIDWRNVGVARQNGMLISRRAKNLERFTGTKPFDMFLCVIGDMGSETLRAAENPAHTEFEFDRITDPIDRKNKLKSYSEFTREMRELIRTHASIDSSAEIFTNDLDDFFEGFNSPSNEKGIFERTIDLVVQKPRRAVFLPSSQFRLGENDTNTREDRKEATKRTQSGNNPRVGIEVIDPRIIKSYDSNSVNIFFTPTIKNSFYFTLYRSGDSERESTKFRYKGEKLWQTEIFMREVKKIERIRLELELHPDELDFVHELVVEVVK